MFSWRAWGIGRDFTEGRFEAREDDSRNNSAFFNAHLQDLDSRELQVIGLGTRRGPPFNDVIHATCFGEHSQPRKKPINLVYTNDDRIGHILTFSI